MAKKRGISGWHSMRKDDLIKALVRDARPKKSKAKKTPASRESTKRTPAKSRANARSVKAESKPSVVARKIQKTRRESDKRRDISTETQIKGRKKRVQEPIKDRIVLMVRDPFWLQANWDLSSRLIQRAEAAMGAQWHAARPILRVFEVATGNTTSTIEKHFRDIEIHGQVNNWYIDVIDPPNSYRVEIGYLASDDSFHTVARSNTVTTPKPGGSDIIDQNWNDVAQNCEEIFALSGGYSQDNGVHVNEIQELFEERLRRPMGSPMVSRYGAGAGPFAPGDEKFDFDVDAEMIVFGSTKSNAHVTLAGKPVELRNDGTFTVRLSMPDRRQVLPVVASSSDGSKQQTIVLAVERNTKVMEPLSNDSE